MNTSPKGHTILLIEDNEGDARLVQEALKEGGSCNRLIVVRDGDEALKYLRCTDKNIAADRPDLILIDLNLPRIGGHEILKVIKNDEKLKNIPIVIFSTSTADQDVLDAYNQHANCYISKPFDIHQYMHVVRSIESFWLGVVKLPSGEN